MFMEVHRFVVFDRKIQMFGSFQELVCGWSLLIKAT